MRRIFLALVTAAAAANVLGCNCTPKKTCALEESQQGTPISNVTLDTGALAAEFAPTGSYDVCNVSVHIGCTGLRQVTLKIQNTLALPPGVLRTVTKTIDNTGVGTPVFENFTIDPVLSVSDGSTYYVVVESTTPAECSWTFGQQSASNPVNGFIDGVSQSGGVFRYLVSSLR